MYLPNVFCYETITKSKWIEHITRFLSLTDICSYEQMSVKWCYGTLFVILHTFLSDGLFATMILSLKNIIWHSWNVLKFTKLYVIELHLFPCLLLILLRVCLVKYKSSFTRVIYRRYNPFFILTVQPLNG